MISKYDSEAAITFQADKEQIARWLSHFAYPVEVRIPDTRHKTLSGYYTPDHFHQLAKDLEYVVGNPGTYGKVDAVYCTLNEFHRSLVARSCNHISPYARDTTADHAIVRRRWLPLDVDADKPKGVCSSDEQKALAKECAEELETCLSSLGFPEPVKGDSGNGWHLLYRLDLPSDDETTATVKAFYDALQRRFAEAWRGRAKLDTSVYNPARIWKLYGTPVQKGDQVPEFGIRHRMATLLSVPETLFPVPFDLLRTATGTPATPSGGNGKMPEFLKGETAGADDKAEDSRRRWEEWIEAHEVETKGDWVPYDDGFKISLAWCPNCQERDGSHILLVHGSGAVDYRCLHDRCKDYRWRRFRMHYEPDAYAKKDDEAGIQDIVNAEKGMVPPSPNGKPKVKFEKWSETKTLASTQTADWIIEGWLEYGCLHAITGLPFSGKSMTVVDILAAMARGKPWCGKEVTPCPFILLDLENKERILVKRMNRALEGDEGRMEELYLRVNPDDLPAVPVPMTYVADCIEAAGAPKGLMVIDTMRTAFQADSNDEKEMLQLLTPLKLIAKRTGWAIVVLHHNAKATNRYSGNTAFAGVLDYMWNWTRDGYAAELSLEGRDDAVEPLCFQFDVDEQRNVFQGTKGESLAADRQEKSDLDLCQVLRHLPDSPNGWTVAQVMTLSCVKKWRCRDLLTRAVNAKCAVKVGLGSIGNPSTYYRTPAGKTLVDKYAGKSLVG